MSTRATYLITTDDWVEMNICYYVHHDGYPEGAASYFLLMHQYKNERSGYARRFFRGVENAEFTRSHEAHGDTEYRYNLDKNGRLTGLERCFNTDTWKPFYQGTWYDFVNEQLKELSCEEKLYLFNLSAYSKNTSVMSLKEAKAYIKHQLDDAAHARKQDWIGNAERAEAKAKIVQEQIDKLIAKKMEGGSHDA